MTLADLPSGLVFSTFLIFCRIGAAMMFLPAIGEGNVPARIRLVFAVLFSFMLMPVYQNIIPKPPTSAIAFALLVGSEVTIGIIIGLLMKLTISALHTLGLTMSFQSGLASGQMFDPSQGSQGSLFGNFMTLFFITLIIVTDLHLALVKAIAHSYDLFQIGSIWQHYDDFTQLVIRTASNAFNIGVKMAAPFMIVALLVYIGSGVLARLLPQFQIFFLVLPAQILMGIFMFMVTATGIAMWFLTYYEESIVDIFGR